MSKSKNTNIRKDLAARKARAQMRYKTKRRMAREHREQQEENEE